MDTTYFTLYLNAVEEAIGKLPLLQLTQAARMLKNAANFNQRVWLVGNGGSAATAMHFAGDLQKVIGVDALALPCFTSTITAYGNDDGWTKMFSLAMKAFNIGNILVAISYSGASQNVIEAAKHALERDGKLIILTGPAWEGNILSCMPGIIIPVENDDIRVVEDVHLAVCHSIIGAIHAVQGLHQALS